MLKEILQFSLVVALVVTKNPLEGSGEYEGLCMDFKEVVYWCTAGIPLGERLMSAISSCYGDGRRCHKGQKCKGKEAGKGKDVFAVGQKCSNVGEVEAWFRAEYQGELCVFSELGWLDNSGNWSEAAAQADLATLSPNVTAVLSEDNIQQCMQMVMEEMAEDKSIKKCVVNGQGNYSEEDLARMEELGNAIAGVQCFLHMFQDSCKDFVGGKVYEALYSSLVPLNP